MTRRPLLVLFHFQLASVAATVVDLGGFSLAVRLGTSPVLATPIGALAGAVTSFLLNRQITFRFRARGGGLSRQAIRYLVVSAASLGLNTLGEGLLFGQLHLHFLVARILTSAAVGLGWNFPLHRSWVFAPAGASGDQALHSVGDEGVGGPDQDV